jgi:small subunit ribosomal protein S20
MANHPSAAKRHRQSLVRRERNKHVLSTVRHALRDARAAVAARAPEASQRVKDAERALRKAASKGVFHPRTIDRTVSRLHKLAGRS